MCNSIFIGCFCVVFHCNTYELYRLFSIEIVIHIELIQIIYIADAKNFTLVQTKILFNSKLNME